MDHYSFVQGRAPPEIYPELVPSPFKKERQNERHIRLPLQHLRYFKKISPLINGLSAFCRNQPSKKGGVNQVSSIHLLCLISPLQSFPLPTISYTFPTPFSLLFFRTEVNPSSQFVLLITIALLATYYYCFITIVKCNSEMVWLETKPNEIN